MVPSIIRLLIPVTSKHFRNTQFHKLGTIYLHQRRANFAGLLMATNEVVRRHDMQAWTHTEHVTLPRALGHPWGKSSYIFYEKFIASNPGIWARVTSAVRLLTRLRHVSQTQKLLRKAEMTK